MHLAVPAIALPAEHAFRIDNLKSRAVIKSRLKVTILSSFCDRAADTLSVHVN